MAWRMMEMWVDPPGEDRRRADRHTLRLPAEASAAGDVVTAQVLDLSEAGLMLHTVAGFAVGDVLQVELADVGEVEARVVWRRNTLFGCEFLVPLTRGAIGAARLKAPCRPRAAPQAEAEDVAVSDPARPRPVARLLLGAALLGAGLIAFRSLLSRN